MTVLPAGALPWQTYRDVRLRALGTNPEAFGSSFEREVAFPDERWVERASNPGTLLWVADDEPDASSGVAPRRAMGRARSRATSRSTRRRHWPGRSSPTEW